MTTLARALVAVVAAWNDFFFRPVDLRVCALIRIAYAALVLVWLAVLYPDLTQWYSEAGTIPLAVARKMMPGSGWTLLALRPHSHLWLITAYTMALAHTLLLLVGLGSRLNAAAVFVWLVSFCNRNEMILDSGDTVFRLVGFFLILMPCGACWSLDALFRLRIADCDQQSAIRVLPGACDFCKSRCASSSSRRASASFSPCGGGMARPCTTFRI